MYGRGTHRRKMNAPRAANFASGQISALSGKVSFQTSVATWVKRTQSGKYVRRSLEAFCRVLHKHPKIRTLLVITYKGIVFAESQTRVKKFSARILMAFLLCSTSSSVVFEGSKMYDDVSCLAWHIISSRGLISLRR